MINIIPLTGLPEIRPGQDIAALLACKLPVSLEPDDILIVTQKVISKAEGRFVKLGEVTPSEKAVNLAAIVKKDARLVELVLRESSDIVRAVPHVLITRHKLGHVMANAGIDSSNIGDGDSDTVLLLPEDPDKSALKIASAIAEICGVRPAVVVSDSFGRPWRMGVTAVAIGVAGMPALIDQRGNLDRNGRTMEVTQIAIGDSVASAANLVMGEGAEGIPAAILRGLTISKPSQGVTALLRSAEEDLFR